MRLAINLTQELFTESAATMNAASQSRSAMGLPLGFGVKRHHKRKGTLAHKHLLLLLVVGCWLFVVCCCCLLFVVCCLLFVVCCLLFVVIASYASRCNVRIVFLTLRSLTQGSCDWYS